MTTPESVWHRSHTAKPIDSSRRKPIDHYMYRLYGTPLNREKRPTESAFTPTKVHVSYVDTIFRSLSRKLPSIICALPTGPFLQWRRRNARHWLPCPPSKNKAAVWAGLYLHKCACIRASVLSCQRSLQRLVAALSSMLKVTNGKNKKIIKSNFKRIGSYVPSEPHFLLVRQESGPTNTIRRYGAPLAWRATTSTAFLPMILVTNKPTYPRDQVAQLFGPSVVGAIAESGGGHVRASARTKQYGERSTRCARRKYRTECKCDHALAGTQL